MAMNVISHEVGVNRLVKFQNFPFSFGYAVKRYLWPYFTGGAKVTIDQLTPGDNTKEGNTMPFSLCSH